MIEGSTSGTRISIAIADGKTTDLLDFQSSPNCILQNPTKPELKRNLVTHATFTLSPLFAAAHFCHRNGIKVLQKIPCHYKTTAQSLTLLFELEPN